MFDVKTSKRIYFLAADTHEEMTTWVQMVCNACGFRKYNKDDVGGKILYFTPWLVLRIRGKPIFFFTAYAVNQDQGEVKEKPNPVSISSPYIHISTCYSGKPSTTKSGPTYSNDFVSAAASSATSSNGVGVFDEMGDDSVFESPSRLEVNVEESVMVSKLSLGSQPTSGLTVLPPGRPPKPPHLAYMQQRQPRTPRLPENYENSSDMQKISLGEQNNNAGNAPDRPPPEISRNLKPGRKNMITAKSKTMGASASSTKHHHLRQPSFPDHSVTLGPPVKRNLKPKPSQTDCEPHRGRFNSIGTSLTSERDRLSSDDGSNSDSESRRGSASEEQIYFYMSSVNMANGSTNQPLMIPAGSFEHPSLSYIDLAFPKEEGKKSEEPVKIVGNQSTTSYITVDFLKTEAFNRTKREIESERYRNNNGQIDLNTSSLFS